MSHKSRILVGDENVERAYRIVHALHEKGYKTSQVHDAGSMIKMIGIFDPDVILLGEFSDTKADGVAVSLRGSSMTQHIPMLIYGGSSDDATRESLRKIQIDAFMDDVIDVDILLARLPRLLRTATMQREMMNRIGTASHFGVSVNPAHFNRFGDKTFKIMIISETFGADTDLVKALGRAGFDITIEHDPYAAGDRLDQERFDSAIVEVGEHDDHERMSYLINHIRNNPRQFNLPVMVIDRGGKMGDALSVYRLGATYVALADETTDTIAFQAGLLVARQRQRWTYRDPIASTLVPETADMELETVYSSAFSCAHLNSVLEHYKKRGGELSIGLISIQNMPAIRRKYGDDAGKVLLSQVANWISGMTRIEDLVGRIQEDRFLIIMNDTPADEASMVINRISGILRYSDFHLTEEVMEAVTVWVQAGMLQPGVDETMEDILAQLNDTIEEV